MKNQEFVHMDAHLDNVLVRGNQIYLTDFGLSLSSFFSLSNKEKHFLDAHLDFV